MHLPLYLSCKDRTRLAGMVTDCDDGIPRIFEIVLDIVRLQIRNRHAGLLHHFNGQWMNLRGRISAGRPYAELGIQMLQASLRHLASATVSCTENQYLLHFVRKVTNNIKKRIMLLIHLTIFYIPRLMRNHSADSIRSLLIFPCHRDGCAIMPNGLTGDGIPSV